MAVKEKNIVIVGLGLIGGSLAKALKETSYNIVGISRSKETIDKAIKDKVISKGFIELSADSLSNSNIIILCSPLNLIPEQIKTIGELVKHEVLLTDAGSTKKDISEVAKMLPPNIKFIGGHPMAGTEKTGYDFSVPKLFENCAWILTAEEDSKEIDDLNEIIKSVGAVPITTTPDMHDKAVCLISHLPLLISIGLCETVKSIEDPALQKLTMQLAASGFRDMTRIGGGNPLMNTNLLSCNLTELSKSLPVYIDELGKAIKMLSEDSSKVEKLLSDISSWRKDLYDENGKNRLINKDSVSV